MDEISIDRLIFDVPGLTPGQARELAERVGEGLAAAAGASGSFDTLRVDLPQQGGSGAGKDPGRKDMPRLADAIVDSLLRQIG